MQVAIKTSALEEKATACNMLVCYFAELQEGMFPYIQPVTNIMVPLLSFIFSEDIRIAASALGSNVVTPTLTYLNAAGVAVWSLTFNLTLTVATDYLEIDLDRLTAVEYTSGTPTNAVPLITAGDFGGIIGKSYRKCSGGFRQARR